jgi:hypothetical protein
MKAKSVVFKDKRGGGKKKGGGQGADEAAGGLCSEFVFVTCVSEVRQEPKHGMQVTKPKAWHTRN